MSWQDGGPGWWQASDGKWYPPELHPSVLGWQPPPGAEDASSSPGGPGPYSAGPYSGAPGPYSAGPYSGGPGQYWGAPGSYPGSPGPYFQQSPFTPPTPKHLSGVLITLIVVASLLVVVGGVLALPGLLRTTSTVPGTGRVPPGSVLPITTTPTQAGVSVDPAEANSVARRLWTDVILARHDRDPGALAIVESGAPLAVDAPQCMAGCPPPYLYNLTAVVVSVPRQSSWPAQFLATASYTENCNTGYSPCDNTFVAVQPTKGAPWTISLFVSYSGPPLAPFLEAGGYDAPPRGGRPISTLTLAYAKYLQAIKTTGAPPASTILQSGAFTTGLVKQLYLSPSMAAAGGYSDSITYKPGAAPAYRFETSLGPLACGTVDWTDTDTALPGKVLVQPLDRASWGPTLAPGTYTRIVDRGVHMNCYVPGISDSSIAYVIGGWDGSTSQVGSG